jgi:hypothetical protein
MAMRLVMAAIIVQPPPQKQNIYHPAGTLGTGTRAGICAEVSIAGRYCECAATA